MARFSLAAVGAVALAALAAADGISGTATMTESSPSGGTCSFSNYSLPPGVSGVGVGPANWANGSKCGSCLQVDGPRGSTKVMVGFRIQFCWWMPERLTVWRPDHG